MSRISFYAASLAACNLVLVPAVVSADDVVVRPVAIAEVTELPTGEEINDLGSTSMDGERVVFYASSYSGWSELRGFWAEEAGRIKAIVNTETLVPGSIIHFSGFEYYDQDGDATVFVGEYPEHCPAESCGGVYVHEGGDYRFIVDTNQPVPDRSGEFGGFKRVALDGDDVAFLGAAQADPDGPVEPVIEYKYGVYADLGEGIVTVADWETPTPGGDGTLDIPRWDEHGLAIEDGVVYFLANDSNHYESGFYSWDSATGTYDVRRDRNTLAPGTSSRFESARGDVYCDGTHAFLGAVTWEDEGVYADFGSGLIEVVGAEDLDPVDAPSGNVSFNQLSACGGTLAFTASDYDTGAPSLYLYRRSDDALIRMLGQGDVVAGRVVQDVQIYEDAVSGESVSAIVRFRDSWNPAVVVATVHRPLHTMLVTRDLNDNGFEEIVLLRQVGQERDYGAQIRDVYTGGMTAMHRLGTMPVYDLATVDRPNGSLRLAVLVQNLARRSLLDFYDPLSGDRKLRVKLWKNTKPTALAVVPDMNGNGFDEIAVTGIDDGGVLKAQVRDTKGGAKISAFKLTVALRPSAMFAIVGRTEIVPTELVLVGVAPDSGLVHTEIVDAMTGVHLGGFDMGKASKWPLMDATLIEDLDGDGVQELAVARIQTVKGKSGWQLWSLSTGLRLQSVFANIPASELAIAPFVDSSGDDLQEIGLMRTKHGGKTLVAVYDSVAAIRLARFGMDALEDGREFATLDDIDGGGMEEFVVLGEHFDSDLLEMRDCGDGTALRYFAVQ